MGIIFNHHPASTPPINGTPPRDWPTNSIGYEDMRLLPLSHANLIGSSLPRMNERRNVLTARACDPPRAFVRMVIGEGCRGTIVGRHFIECYDTCLAAFIPDLELERYPVESDPCLCSSRITGPMPGL